MRMIIYFVHAGWWMTIGATLVYLVYWGLWNYPTRKTWSTNQYGGMAESYFINHQTWDVTWFINFTRISCRKTTCLNTKVGDSTSPKEFVRRFKPTAFRFGVYRGSVDWKGAKLCLDKFTGMNSMTTGKKCTSKPLLPWIWQWLDNPPLDTWEMMDWWTQGLRPSRFLSLFRDGLEQSKIRVDSDLIQLL